MMNVNLRKPIPGGYILLARKIERSGIFEKPPLYSKLWLWMLLNASFKDHGHLQRGQFFTTLETLRNAMSFKIGYRLVKPTTREIRSATEFLTKHQMIVTTKVIHGMVITIQNYNYYQDCKNYEGHAEGHAEGHTEGTILIKKDLKNENNSEKISALKSRYSDPSIIERAFEAIASNRKSGKVADSVIIAQLKKWDQYSIEQVVSGIRVYLDKDCAGDGKDEKYLFGIIRNQIKKYNRQGSKSYNQSVQDNKPSEPKYFDFNNQFVEIEQ